MSSKSKINFRAAQNDDLGILNDMVRASKAYWGYSDDFMNRFMDLFQLTENYLAHNSVYVILLDYVVLNCMKITVWN